MTLVSDEINTTSGDRAVVQRRKIAALSQAGRLIESRTRDRDPFDSQVVEVAAPASNVSWERYARRVLWALASDEENGITYARADRYFRFLAKCMTPETVFPFFSPDLEGGLVIEWSAGSMLIEVDLESDGEYFLLQSNGSDDPPVKDRGRISEFDTERLGAMLAHFSQAVAARNPEWRQYFS